MNIHELNLLTLLNELLFCQAEKQSVLLLENSINDRIKIKDMLIINDAAIIAATTWSLIDLLLY